MSDSGWLVLNGGPVENCILRLDPEGLGHSSGGWWRDLNGDLFDIVGFFSVSGSFFMNSTVVSTCAQYLYQKNWIDALQSACLERNEILSLFLFVCSRLDWLMYFKINQKYLLK